MNSRFKFRVWNKYTHTTPAEQMQFLCFNGCLVDSDGCHHCPDDYIIEQCTEFFDKNGKPIYEGDKVEITIFGSIGPNGGYADSDTQYQGIVVWKKQGFYVEVADNFFYIPEDPENVEIIGNIHVGIKEE